jgi:hypothetical protein
LIPLFLLPEAPFYGFDQMLKLSENALKPWKHETLFCKAQLPGVFCRNRSLGRRLSQVAAEAADWDYIILIMIRIA